MEDDPVSVFDFPENDEEYCEICGTILDYHERLGICYECEMGMEIVIEECFTDSDTE